MSFCMHSTVDGWGDLRLRYWLRPKNPLAEHFIRRFTSSNENEWINQWEMCACVATRESNKLHFYLRRKEIRCIISERKIHYLCWLYSVFAAACVNHQREITKERKLTRMLWHMQFCLFRSGFLSLFFQICINFIKCIVSFCWQSQTHTHTRNECGRFPFQMFRTDDVVNNNNNNDDIANVIESKWFFVCAMLMKLSSQTRLNVTYLGSVFLRCSPKPCSTYLTCAWVGVCLYHQIITAVDCLCHMKFSLSVTNFFFARALRLLIHSFKRVHKLGKARSTRAFHRMNKICFVH